MNVGLRQEADISLQRLPGSSRPEAVSQGYVRKQTFVVHIVHETSSEAVQQLGHPFKLIEIENICRKSFTT